MNTAESRITRILEGLGLSTNASKAYISLLKQNPATGYEVSTRAGVPRSAIYAVLKSLETEGVVNSVGTKPKRYIPISPSGLIEQFQHRHTESISSLESALEALDTDTEQFDFWHIQGYQNLIPRMKEAIAGADRSVYLSAWTSQIADLEDDLEQAEDRGVKVTLFSFCNLRKSYGTTISYGLPEEQLLEIWNPKVILVVDRKTAIMGSGRMQSDARSIWSNNKAIIEIATNHIILDITLAGQRLKLNVAPTVEEMMEKPSSQLEELISRNSEKAMGKSGKR